MSCMLHVSGENFDVDDFLSKTKWGEFQVRVYRKGEKLPFRGLGVYGDSGFSICVSEAEFEDFEAQQLDVIKFIKKYKANFELLKTYPIDYWRQFDFGLSTYPSNQFSRTYVMSSELLRLVGETGMDILMSNYFTRNDDYLRRRARKHKKAWPVKKSS